MSAFGGSKINTFDSVFLNNPAEALGNTTSGGALFAALRSTMTIDHCHFTENRASLSGGAIVVYMALSNSHEA